MLFKRATDTCLSLRLLVHAIQRQSSQDFRNGHHSLYQGYPLFHANTSTSHCFSFCSHNDQTLFAFNSLFRNSSHNPIFTMSTATQTSQQNSAPSSPNPNQEIDSGAIITNAVPVSMVSPTSIKKKRST